MKMTEGMCSVHYDEHVKLKNRPTQKQINAMGAIIAGHFYFDTGDEISVSWEDGRIHVYTSERLTHISSSEYISDDDADHIIKVYKVNIKDPPPIEMDWLSGEHPPEGATELTALQRLERFAQMKMPDDDDD